MVDSWSVLFGSLMEYPNWGSTAVPLFYNVLVKSLLGLRAREGLGCAKGQEPWIF